MTSPRFSDPPLVEMDTTPEEPRASAGYIGGETTSVGASTPPAAASRGHRDDSSLANQTRSQSPLSQSFDEVTGRHRQYQNPFAFAPGEHLAHPHLSLQVWDGRDLTGFHVHLPDHGREAQQAIWSAYTSSLQPSYDFVELGSRRKNAGEDWEQEDNGNSGLIHEEGLVREVEGAWGYGDREEEIGRASCRERVF